MAPPSRVLWCSNTEWMEVYTLLFMPSASHKKLALEKIAELEQKTSHIIEAVRCTRLLLEASLSDSASATPPDSVENKELSQQPGSQREHDIKMLYSLAVVRFVDQYLELERKKSQLDSYSSDELPPEILDCRNRFTQRQELPSLTILRYTAEACFNYIAAKYWHPQADQVRSRLLTIAHSKHLASGLVAVLQDLEVLLPPDPQMEASLASLLTNVAFRRNAGSPPPSVRQLLQCAAAVVGLKQRDTMRALRRFKLAEVLSEPVFVSATSWCQTLRESLPRCLSFIESIFHASPHENVTLSFLKDFILLLCDPDILASAPLVLSVFWILSRGSSRMIDRLISLLIRGIVGLPCEKESPGETQDTPLSSWSSLDSENAPVVEEAQSSQRLSTGCFDYESFSLWLRTTDVPLKEEKQLKLHLCCNFGYQSRLLSWLRCLLLIPAPLQNDANSVSSSLLLPHGLDFLLHLFCGPQIDALLQSIAYHHPVRHVGLNGVPSSSKDTSCCQRFFNALQFTHTRVVTACRSNLDILAQTTHQCFTMKEKVGSERGLRAVLRLLKESDKLFASTGPGGPVLEWLNRKLDATMPHLAAKRCVIQRLFSSQERRFDSSLKVQDASSLLDEFSSRLLSFQNKMQPSSSPNSEGHSSAITHSTVSCQNVIGAQAAAWPLIKKDASSKARTRQASASGYRSASSSPEKRSTRTQEAALQQVHESSNANVSTSQTSLFCSHMPLIDTATAQKVSGQQFQSLLKHKNEFSKGMEFPRYKRAFPSESSFQMLKKSRGEDEHELGPSPLKGTRCGVSNIVMAEDGVSSVQPSGTPYFSSSVHTNSNSLSFCSVSSAYTPSSAPACPGAPAALHDQPGFSSGNQMQLSNCPQSMYD